MILPGIAATSIVERLRQIVEAEGVSAEPEALEVLARRAAGSMRDSQSLLEQLLAFAPERITVADVHGMLGSAKDERLALLGAHLVGRNAAAALAELDAAVEEGVDVALLLEQLLTYLRDCMVAAVGGPAETFLAVSSSGQAQVSELGRRWGLETILAAMQILDQTLSRMRYSTQGRILAELALVRICQLEELEELASLVAQLQEGKLPIAGNGGGSERPSTPAAAPAPMSPPISAARSAAEASAAAAKKKSGASGR